MLRLMNGVYKIIIILMLLTRAVSAHADDCDDILNAAKHGDSETLTELLDEGCDVNTKDENGWTPLLLASTKDHVEMVELLLDRSADPELATEKDGKTALMWAVGEENIEIIRLLIDKGADINAKGKFENTALRIAKRRKFNDIIELLQEAGAKE